MNRATALILHGLCLFTLAACGGGTPDPDPDDPAPLAGLMRAVSDPADLEASIKAGFTAMNATGPEALAAGDPAPGDSAGNFTGTYTQEQNVDEFDAVRYDGSQLYIAPRRYLNCCFAFIDDGGDGVVSSGNDPERSIRILSTDPGSATARLTGTIPLEDNTSVQGMYLEGDRMFALTGNSFYGNFGGFWGEPALWAPEQLGLRVYDVSNPALPTLEFDAQIDGVFIDSRRIGNTVYVVSRYTPQVPGIEYYVTTTAQQAQNQAVLASVTLDDLLPTITIDGTTRPLVAPERCYIPTDSAEVGYPVITSVTAVPIDNPAAFTTTCYNEEAYGIYVSTSALYVTQLVFNQADSKSQSRIHKFAFSGMSLRYKGSAEVDGQVWRGGQADFRMNEYAGDLRVFASQYDWTNSDFVDHKLYVLRESPTHPELDIISELPNEQRPTEIGKPNEALYGVRFHADRAYAITFQQIDPLYVIDLAEAADPRIAGELEVTGFSDFLHPVNDDLLLGLGRAGNGGIKLELFDVSDIGRPLSRGSATLGGPGSYSEAIHDRHAFTYQPDVNGVDRFTIPADIYDEVNGLRAPGASGLYLFEIRDKLMPALASLNAAGSIVPPRDGSLVPWITRNRAFINGDTVYYIQDEAVWSAFWNSPSLVNGPF